MTTEPHLAAAPRVELGADAKTLLAVNGLSSIAVGMVLPYTLIFLNRETALSLGEAGTGLTAALAVGLVFGPVWGSLVDRWGARATLTVAAAGQAMALAVIATSPSARVAIGGLMVLQFFQAATYPSLGVAFARMAHDEALSRLFSLNFAVGNVCVGVGGALAGVILAVTDGGLRWFYAVDAMAFAVMAAVALAVVPAGSAPTAEPGDLSRPGSWRGALATQGFWVVVGVSLVLTLLGPAVLEYGAQVMVTQTDRSATWFLGGAIAVNTASIGVFQLLVGRRLERYQPEQLLMTACLAYLLANVLLVVPVAVDVPSVVLVCVLAILAVVVGLGEVLQAPAMGPLTTRLAPQHLRGRFHSGVSTSFGLAYTAAPTALTAALASGVGGGVGWLLAGVALTVAVALLLRRAKPHESDVDRLRARA